MIGSVISFCTTEYRFLEACIRSVQPFSSQVIVTVSDHLFDGREENYALLEQAYRRFPEVTFIEFAYDPEKSYHYTSTLSKDHPHRRHEWHNTGRWISLFFLKGEIQTLYFCDADEVVDTPRFLAWLENSDWEQYTVLRLASTRYFREARFQAITHDLTSTLVRREGLDPALLWSEHERMGIYLDLPGKKLLDVKDLSGKPMIHHYSWVRTKEELLKKVTTWGHFWERNWVQLIEEEYARPFQGTDFVRNEAYIEVEPFFDPLQVEVPALEYVSRDQHLENIQDFGSVTRVTPEEMFRREILSKLEVI